MQNSVQNRTENGSKMHVFGLFSSLFRRVIDADVEYLAAAAEHTNLRLIVNRTRFALPHGLIAYGLLSRRNAV